MNSDVLSDLQRRLDGLEASTVRYRAGEITGVAPLAVALGGSSVPYENVRSVTAGLDAGEQVSVLMFGNDLLVLGRRLAGAPEAVTLIGSGGSAPAFAGTWTNFDAPDRPAGYYRHDGHVHLFGLIKTGTIGTAAFTLPTGYRPTTANGKSRLFAVASNDAFGVVSVTSAGVVTPAVGNTTYVSLDGISFRHA